MQPLAVGEKTYHARIRRTALSIYRQQSRILYNSTMEIGKFTKNESTNDSDNQPRRAEASHKDRLGEATIAQKQWSGGSRVIKIHSAIPGGGVSKKKVSRLADRLSGKKACLVVRVNHSVVSVADLCCCLV